MSKQVTKTDKSKGGKDKKKEEQKVEEFPELTGTGKFTYTTGSVYIGDYKQLTTGAKIREGKGKLIHSPNEDCSDGIEWYEGDWKEDKMEGYGVYHYSNGDRYEGNWVNNMQHGVGTYVFTNGTRYEGEWKNHKMHGKGKYLNMHNKGWGGEFQEGGFHSKDQADLIENKRILTRIQEIRQLPYECFFNVWDDVYNKADKKTIKDALSPFFAKSELLGQYINETFPKFEDRSADKWNEAIRFAFGQVAGKAPAAKGQEQKEGPKPNVTYNAPRNGDDLLFMNKEGLLAPQITEELESGQVVEIVAVLENRKVQLGLGYCKEVDKWMIVFFSDVTEKAAKK